MNEEKLRILLHAHRTKSFGGGKHIRAKDGLISSCGTRQGWQVIDDLVDDGFLKAVPDNMIATDKGLNILKIKGLL